MAQPVIARGTAFVVAAVVLLIGGSLAAWYASKRGDRPPSVPSAGTASTTAAASWPTYGRTASRLHAAPFTLRPPYRRLWSVYGDDSFIEFPPVLAAGRLYFATDRGRVVAVETHDGTVVWDRFLGHCTAASPALQRTVLVVAAMAPPPCNRGRGAVVALDARTGRTIWRFGAAPIESSPLIVGGSVVVGDHDGNVYAIALTNGRVRWRYRTGAAVKGSASAALGTIYLGSYDRRVYAFSAATGRIRWRTEPAAGRFYATPAVAGRSVFIGATDGTFYSFDSRSGSVRWARRLPSFVYSSAAVAHGRVFVGSYDHRLYAFAASSGRQLWSYKGRGPVSGTPVVLDGLVYFSTCGSCSRYESDPTARRTYALDVRSGSLVWSFPDGEYSPVVSDGARVYVTGYTSVHAFAPAGHDRGRR